jgi:MFS family permease
MGSLSRRSWWTFWVTCIALFMVVLDNLVVTTALPSIRADLGASIEDLEWTVNAYTLSFAVLLLTGAALGDRFGRRLMFAVGLAIFTAASAAAALAPDVSSLIAARAVQGAGGALVMPLTLTILSAAFPAERRGMAIGAWSGISGLAVAIGPLVGGAVVDGISWQWIFWLNVPIGIAAIPLVAAFVAWEMRAPAPMLPMRFFRTRAFSAANGLSFLMYFGMFGSIFLLTQFLQTAQGYSALGAGVRTLPWTAMIMFVAPVAGALSDRIGGRSLMSTGLALQAGALAWMAAISSPDLAYGNLVVPFAMAGLGMGLVFAPVANVVLGAVRPQEQGQASGANNALRELGGVFGVAVMASVFSRFGGYESPQAFTDGLIPAVWVGAAVVGVGALVALLVPPKRPPAAEIVREPVPAGEPALAGERS